jgi:methionyl-tRNA formyltransferase
MMVEGVVQLQKNSEYVLEFQSKNPQHSLRTYPRNPEDGKIDWTKSNEDILRLINASSEPFPGAFCFFKEQKIIIWRAEIFEDEEKYSAIAGQVSKIDSAGFVEVITGNGKIRITEIQADEKRIAPAQLITSSRQRLK